MPSQQQRQDEPAMLSVAEVAKRLRHAEQTVYNLLTSGKLKGYRCPGWRVSEEQLQAYLEETKQERGQPEPRKSKRPRPKLRHIRL